MIIFYFTPKQFFYVEENIFLGKVNYFTLIWFLIPIFYLQVNRSIRCLFLGWMNLNLSSLSSTAQDLYIRGTKKSFIILYCCWRFIRQPWNKLNWETCILYCYIVSLCSLLNTTMHSSSILYWQKAATLISPVSRLAGVPLLLLLCAAVSWSCGFIQTCAIYINGQKSPPCDWSLPVLLQALPSHHPLCKTNKVSLL